MTSAFLLILVRWFDAAQNRRRVCLGKMLCWCGHWTDTSHRRNGVRHREAGHLRVTSSTVTPRWLPCLSPGWVILQWAVGGRFNSANLPAAVSWAEDKTETESRRWSRLVFTPRCLTYMLICALRQEDRANDHFKCKKKANLRLEVTVVNRFFHICTERMEWVAHRGRETSAVWVRVMIGDTMTLLSLLGRIMRYFLLRPETLFLLCISLALWSYFFHTDEVKTIVKSSRDAVKMVKGKVAEMMQNDRLGGLNVLDAEFSKTWEFKNNNVAVYSIQGRRDHMEDRFEVLTDISNKSHPSIFGIFDGHGGEVGWEGEVTQARGCHDASV